MAIRINNEDRMSSKIASGLFGFNVKCEVPGLHLIFNNTFPAATKGHGRAAFGLACAGPESVVAELGLVPALRAWLGIGGGLGKFRK